MLKKHHIFKLALKNGALASKKLRTFIAACMRLLLLIARSFAGFLQLIKFSERIFVP